MPGAEVDGLLLVVNELYESGWFIQPKVHCAKCATLAQFLKCGTVWWHSEARMTIECP